MFSFLDDLERIKGSTFCPTVDDILRARMETTGVAQIHYCYKDLNFRYVFSWVFCRVCLIVCAYYNFYSIYDVGGQKNERRKWLHLFGNNAFCIQKICVLAKKGTYLTKIYVVCLLTAIVCKDNVKFCF